MTLKQFCSLFCICKEKQTGTAEQKPLHRVKQAVQKQPRALKSHSTCSFTAPFEGKRNTSIVKSNLTEARSSHCQAHSVPEPEERTQLEQRGVQGGALASLQVDVTEMREVISRQNFAGKKHHMLTTEQPIQTQTVLWEGRFPALVCFLHCLQDEGCWRTQDVFS